MKQLIRLALEEDRTTRDVTTTALAAFDRPAKARVTAKAAGVVSGMEPFRDVFLEVDRNLLLEIKKGNGSIVQPGDEVAVIDGSEGAILRAERTALNFLQSLSGIATATRKYIERIGDLPVQLLDTRKTTPGMRYLEKQAVRDGGGANHRANLEDMALIKENHIAMAGGITAAVEAVRSRTPDIMMEVEVRNLAEFDEARACGVLWIMLDNFTPEDVREAVRRNRKQAKLEISGNVTLENIREKAELGVDFISSGALTHSAPALDFTLLIERLT